MVLSNPRSFFLLAQVCVIFLQACGSSPGNGNKPFSLTAETKSEFPFSTKEPEVYQGDFVVSNGKDERLTFVARKGGKWRFDSFLSKELSTTTLSTNKLYLVDHIKKIYASPPDNSHFKNDPLDVMTSDFFKGKEYLEFEDLGREGNLRKYLVSETGRSKDDILIYIDDASGIVVRQDFIGRKAEANIPPQAKYFYEIRNLKLEVDDSLFAIPDGYRKVTWDAYRIQTKQK